MRVSILYLLVAFGASVALGQKPDLAGEFEVASIHPSPPDGKHGVWTDGSPTQIRMLGMNVRELMGFAYDMEGFRISNQGQPPADAYDIFAKVPSDVAKLPDSQRWTQIHVMTQALLASRFKLVYHKGSEEKLVYTLGPAKGGVKIKELGPSRNENVMVDRRAGHLAAQEMPMSQLVSILRSELHRPVLDETGVKGIFNVALEWSPESTNPQTATDLTDTRPSLSEALEEKLGLKLVSGRKPIEVLIIDHVEKPSEN